MKKIAMMVTIILLFLTACSKQEGPPVELLRYLENKKFKIISYEGRQPSFLLTKENLLNSSYMMSWGLQDPDLDLIKLLGKTVYVEKFVVTNHPISTANVDVIVFVIDNKPIGGISNESPNNNVIQLGGGYSIDGKTIEEVHDMNFDEWQTYWMDKYSK